ncbi:flagellar filament capping protein FliD [Hylemonella gracilis]|nr:flagellar filament capping protein FliD [Hylemonella gracilis]
MATMSSVGIGTNGLDVQSIVSQLVALEKKPLETLKLKAATTQAKITTMGQIKSLVDTLNTAVSKLTSVTGWNSVATSSSASDYVTATAIGGTQSTSFAVEVQQLATARATASQSLTAGSFVGEGTLTFTVNGQSVDVAVSATDTLSDVASAINGSAAGVTATIMKDASGERLLLSSKETGAAKAFSLTVNDIDGDNADNNGLSRLLNGATQTQAAQDAQATINGIAVTSGTNTFENVVSGVTLTVKKVTTSAATVSVTKDVSAMKSNIEAFVKAYNDVNGVLNEATKYDQGTQVGGLFQGDSTIIALQSALRTALQTVNTSGGPGAAYTTLSSVGITVAAPVIGSTSVTGGGTLEIDSTKLTAALANPDAMKALFSSTDAGSAQGIAVKIKSVTSALLANSGFFQRKDDALERELDSNEEQQTAVNDKASRVEEQLNRKYSALDLQMTQLNSLSTYLTQQIAQWNKSSS